MRELTVRAAAPQVQAGARLAVRCGAKSSLLVVLASSKGQTPLHEAANHGHPAVCEQLLAAKADPAGKGTALWGLTALEHARFRSSGKRRGGRASAPIEALLSA